MRATALDSADRGAKLSSMSKHDFLSVTPEAMDALEGDAPVLSLGEGVMTDRQLRYNLLLIEVHLASVKLEFALRARAHGVSPEGSETRLAELASERDELKRDVERFVGRPFGSVPSDAERAELITALGEDLFEGLECDMHATEVPFSDRKLRGYQLLLRWRAQLGACELFRRERRNTRVLTVELTGEWEARTRSHHAAIVELRREVEEHTANGRVALLTDLPEA